MSRLPPDLSCRCWAGSTSIAEDDIDGRLIIKSGPQRIGEQILLRGQSAIEIGKMPGKPIELLGNLVSRNHCRLVRTPAAWRLEDNKSTNGLFVNNKRIATADLKPGDCLRVGEYELEYAIPQPEGSSALDEVEDIYDVAEEPAAPRASVVAQPVNEYQPGPDSISCPSCGKYFPPKAKICVNCGIDIKTGKAILVSSEVDENVLFANTESVARILSWFIPIGLYPVASEGYGKHKPYVVWAITALTILITVLVWIGGGSSADGPGAEKSLMMWCGRTSTVRDIERGEEMNEFTRWGDAVAFKKKFDEYKAQKLSDDDARVKAYNDLSPDQQFYGTFSLYQLITNGFLHGGIMHLAGNLVFLLVFGSRVNAMVGRWRTAVLYPVLLIIASTAELISMMGGRPTPARRIRCDNGSGRNVLRDLSRPPGLHGLLDSPWPADRIPHEDENLGSPRLLGSPVLYRL